MQPHDLDSILQQEYPLHIVGVHAPFEPLCAPGSRLLLTSDGLLLEACNGVFRSVQMLAELNCAIDLPYGQVDCGITTLDHFTADSLGGLVREFAETARRALPLEAIMLVVKAPGQPARCIHPDRGATTGRVNYDLKDLEAGEHVILDIHSHGTHPAFFSSEDNFDDSKYRGNLKNCYVLGNLDQTQLSYTHRWVSRGHIFAQQGQAKVAENPGAPAC